MHDTTTRQPAQSLFAIPSEMTKAKRWLTWKAIKRDDGSIGKQPFYCNGRPRKGTLDRPEDIAQLGAYEEASSLSHRIGFALGPDQASDEHWQGIDLDDIIDSQGKVEPWAVNLLQAARDIGAYIEFGPSGNGIHIVGRGQRFPSMGKKHNIEAYCQGRFFTFTGEFVDAHAPELPDLSPLLPLLHAHRGTVPKPEHEIKDNSFGEDWEGNKPTVQWALSVLSPDMDNEEWHDIMRGVWRTGGGNDESCDLIIKWSMQSEKWAKNKPSMHPKARWKAWNKQRAAEGEPAKVITLGTVKWMAEQAVFAAELAEEMAAADREWSPGLNGHDSLSGERPDTAIGPSPPPTPSDARSGPRDAHDAPSTAQTPDPAEPTGDPSKDRDLGPKGSPLTRYVELNLDEVEAPEFVLDNIIEASVSITAGGHGQGKTVQLVSLLAKVGWLCRDGDPLKPALRRKVIYITEDYKQVLRILTSIYRFGNTGKSLADFQEWFKVVKAVRGKVSALINARKEDWCNQTTVNVSRKTGNVYTADPVIVIDTKTAVFDIKEENENAEISQVIADLKQQVDLPIILVGHIPKAINREDVKSFSLRGASAAEGDANQTNFFYYDEASGKRYLHLTSPGKRRFDSHVVAIEFTSVENTVTVKNQLGEPVPHLLRHADCNPLDATTYAMFLKESKALKREQKSGITRNELQNKIYNAIQQGVASGEPMTKTAVRELLGINRENCKEAIDAMQRTGQIVECLTPEGARIVHNSKNKWLVALDDVEAFDFMTSLGNAINPKHLKVPGFLLKDPNEELLGIPNRTPVTSPEGTGGRDG